MFKLGDKLTKQNYTQGAIWCNENHAIIDPETWEIKEIPAPTVAERAQFEIEYLKQSLSDTDYAVIKIAEGAATPEEYADIIGQRATWRARINELEAELGR